MASDLEAGFVSPMTLSRQKRRRLVLYIVTLGFMFLALSTLDVYKDSKALQLALSTTALPVKPLTLNPGSVDAETMKLFSEEELRDEVNALISRLAPAPSPPPLPSSSSSSSDVPSAPRPLPDPASLPSRPSPDAPTSPSASTPSSPSSPSSPASSTDDLWAASPSRHAAMDSGELEQVFRHAADAFHDPALADARGKAMGEDTVVELQSLELQAVHGDCGTSVAGGESGWFKSGSHVEDVLERVEEGSDLWMEWCGLAGTRKADAMRYFISRFNQMMADALGEAAAAAEEGVGGEGVQEGGGDDLQRAGER